MNKEFLNFLNEDVWLKGTENHKELIKIKQKYLETHKEESLEELEKTIHPTNMPYISILGNDSVMIEGIATQKILKAILNKLEELEDEQ